MSKLCKAHVYFIATCRNAVINQKHSHKAIRVRSAGVSVSSTSRYVLFSCSGGDDSLSFYWAVRRNDLTPGIPASDYEQRRRNLMESLPDRSIVISVAAPMKYMSASTFALLNCILRNAKFTLVLFRYLVSFLSAFDDETEESMSS